MKIMSVRLLRICFALLFFGSLAGAALPRENTVTKNVLILVEGSGDLRNYAMGDGRQLATLLGHFDTRVTLKPNFCSTG